MNNNTITKIATNLFALDKKQQSMQKENCSVGIYETKIHEKKNDDN